MNLIELFQLLKKIQNLKTDKCLTVKKRSITFVFLLIKYFFFVEGFIDKKNLQILYYIMVSVFPRNFHNILHAQ